MTYTLGALALLLGAAAVALVRGQFRRRHEMRALRTVMRSVMNEGPEGSQGKDR